MYEIAFKPAAAKTLRRLPRKQAEDFRARIGAVANNVRGTSEDVSRLKGSDDRYRLRIGGWRILFELDRDERTMTVVRIRTRGDAYK